jgi:hypothetical protein
MNFATKRVARSIRLKSDIASQRTPCRVIGNAFLGLLCLCIAMYTRGQEPASSASTATPTVSFSTLPALQATTPKPGTTHVPGDFNGDSVSDLLWFNPTLSEVGYWTMSVTDGVSQASVHKYNVTSGYFVGAVGDFNGDGFADLMFTSANHDIYLWANNQNGGFTSTYVGTYPSNWQLIGAGDVDGDGNDDLLWLDSSDCEFAYWTMNGAVRTGYKIINIACGYYPISIGYYSPSNRLSIVWTDGANDEYIWDSTGTGFVSYNVTNYFNTWLGGFTNIWAFGGGYAGQGIGVEGSFVDGSAHEGLISRTFDANGIQTGLSGGYQSGGALGGASSADGYLIESNGVNATGLYAQNGSASDGICLMTDGVYNGNYLTSGNAPIFSGNCNWQAPPGWYIVGTAASKLAPAIIP